MSKSVLHMFSSDSFIVPGLMFRSLIHLEFIFVYAVFVQSLSHIWLFMTPWTSCCPPGFLFLHHLPEFVETHVCWVDDAIQPSHLPSSPSYALSLSQHEGLSSESALHIRWPKYWSFSFSISPYSEYSGLTSFRIDCFDLLAVQGTLKSFPAP